MVQFNFLRRSGKDLDDISTSQDINQFFPDWQEEDENVVFIGPHDDDIFLGAGLLVQAVSNYDGNPRFLIVTDGRNGYCSEAEKDTISMIREGEMLKAASLLGINKTSIVRLDYPDGDLAKYYLTSDDGLIRRLTQTFKRLNATRIVLPTINDIHPDHKYTNEAARIAYFHANGGIWDGRKTNIKTILESAVYCDFDENPDLALRTDHTTSERKLEAIKAFASQRQIDTLVERAKQDRSVEIFKTLNFLGYSARETFERLFRS